MPEDCILLRFQTRARGQPLLTPTLDRNTEAVGAIEDEGMKR